ncbi:NAD(+) diphosphatase [Sphingomonas sp.]|uniref:NAD(+) diphosphatase n=1 Tax=Sphingomonas sp. TaxID=28214 RepID=UPI001B2486FE|nr:NAD(+) diphosphatase [Sphingomonas sp.]MBO9714190.1 NAD(+) diphosphatase [Sphingomonas sp.]
MKGPWFTGATIDRADNVRADDAAIAAARADPAARLLRLAGLDPLLDDAGLLVWDTLDAAGPDDDLVFLGFDSGCPRFAVANRTAPAVTGRSLEIMGLVARMQAEEAALYAGARSLIDWHMRHRFCANCGHATAPFKAGWARRCPNCGAEHFPRTDPVVIMLAEYEGRALVGRGRGWPERRYSALAGFVEPGESIEEAVARETFEEAGVRVRDVRYVASQPWPFPSSLMIGCTSTADGDAITVDTSELEDVIWVTRDEVRASLAGEPAPFLAPPRFAIARTLLKAWLAEG